jgi:1,4-dihydroxy-2-naphthoyl-CoA hydrolase
LKTRIDRLRALAEGTLGSHLGITLLDITPERVTASMPVTRAVQQPFGLLHGGASVALAETVASIGAWMNVDEATQAAVGIEINANHLAAKRDGIVLATALPLHRGGRTHVWEVRITDEEDELVCISRCTLAIIQLKPKP